MAVIKPHGSDELNPLFVYDTTENEALQNEVMALREMGPGPEKKVNPAVLDVPKPILFNPPRETLVKSQKTGENKQAARAPAMAAAHDRNLQGETPPKLTEQEYNTDRVNNTEEIIETMKWRLKIEKER